MKIWLVIYTICSGLCGLFDFFVLFVVLKHFGDPGDEAAEMVLLMLNITFFLCTFVWASFVVQLKYRVPDYIGKLLMDAMFGFSKHVLKEGKQYTGK